VVYFDAEILVLYGMAELQVPPDCIFSREEFDLAFALVQALDPFRHFTKWAQLRNVVTLGFVPEKVEKLLDDIAVGFFDHRLQGRMATIIEPVHALQRRLSYAVIARFAPIFEASSLALSARYLLPGTNLFTFRHFPSIDEHGMQTVRQIGAAFSY